MPVSLSLYLYRCYQRKVQKKFDEHNSVLSQKDVEELIEGEDKVRTIRFFRSAVVDHIPVEGRPYYLRYPLESIFYHDGFKRAAIADAVGSLAIGSNKRTGEDALVILDELIDPEKTAPYVQVLAWHSLAGLTDRLPSVIHKKKERLMEAFGGRSASVLGALIFIETLLQGEHKIKALEMFLEGRIKVRYRVQKALLNAFMYYRKEFPDPTEDPALEADIRHFLNRLDSRRYFTREETHEGLREIGLIPMHVRPELWANTPQADLARRLEAVAGRYIGTMGAFIKQW